MRRHSRTTQHEDSFGRRALCHRRRGTWRAVCSRGKANRSRTRHGDSTVRTVLERNVWLYAGRERGQGQLSRDGRALPLTTASTRTASSWPSHLRTQRRLSRFQNRTVVS